MHLAQRMLVILGAAALGSSASHEQASVYNNLRSTIGNYHPIAGDGQPNTGPLANSFSTGSSNGVLIDVKVYLERMAAPFGSFNVALYSSSGNHPSNQIRLLGTLNDTAVSTNGGIYDFPVSAGVPLTANTRYFITLSANNSGSQATSTYWATSDSMSGAGKTTETFLMSVTARPAVTRAVAPPVLTPSTTATLMLLLAGSMTFLLRRSRLQRA